VADIKTHNNLIKVVFDGNKHLKHVMSSKQIKKITVYENSYPLTRLPVCGHCEKLAYWNKGGTAYCPTCGTYTKKPITYATYLASGYDIDETTCRWRLQQEKEKRKKALPAYGE